MENQFIKKGTKTNCITASVIAGICLLTLVMLLFLLQVDAGAKALIAFVFTVSLVFLITLWVGILQIKIFNDYKSQKKSLCAEGIFIICLTVLTIITAILFYVLQAGAVFGTGTITSVDIRYFLAVFLLAFGVWKIFVAVASYKEKRFNWWLEVVLAGLWVGFSALTLTSTFVNGAVLTTILWLFVVFGWAMIITYIVFLLYSYIFNSPKYLETPEAIQLLEKDVATKNSRLARVNAMVSGGAVETQKVQSKTSDDLETKLKKLDNLLAKNILTKEEYDEKRKQIIKESL
ncbi:MAG: SHOCT domain-containing protein [Clostridia bacterium]|nr:SHOCT domain-containing protein [Clostridia bacterium]